jgi:hypothetical protein
MAQRPANPTATWQEASAMFAATSLPEPPPSTFRPSQLMRIDEHLFATWQPQTDPYAFSSFMQESLRAAPNPGLAFGFAGHGVQSWAMHYVLREGPLLVGFQVAAEGIYTNADRARESLEGAWELLLQLHEKLALTAVKSQLPAGRTLVIIDSDLEDNRWAWVDGPGGWERAKWEEGSPAAFMALMHLQDLAEGATAPV